MPRRHARRYEDWELDHRPGQDLDSTRMLRNEIEARVARLVKDLLD